eukprot:3062473-Prymnesium_polylepis.1
MAFGSSLAGRKVEPGPTCYHTVRRRGTGMGTGSRLLNGFSLYLASRRTCTTRSSSRENLETVAIFSARLDSSPVRRPRVRTRGAARQS